MALAYNNRGLVRYLLVEFDAAIEDFTSALHLNDQLAMAYYNRGLVYYRLGKYLSTSHYEKWKIFCNMIELVSVPETWFY